jgi:hypothetical protein
MTAALLFAFRGALGFGLGGGLLLGVVSLSSRSTAEEISFLGEWQARRSLSTSPIRSAEFGEDGTLHLLTPGGEYSAARYRVLDATNAVITGDVPWTRARLILNPDYPTMAATDLELSDKAGAIVEMRWFRRKGPGAGGSTGTSLGGIVALVFLSGAIAAVVLTVGTGKTVAAAIGFGCGAVPASFVVLFVMISLQGGGQPDYVWGALGCGFGFAVMGAVGGFAIRPVLFLAGAVSFGIAGAVWGGVVFWMTAHEGSGVSSLGTLAGVAGFVVPVILGGGVFGLVLGLFGTNAEN